jgi:hypothetical protein
VELRREQKDERLAENAGLEEDEYAVGRRDKVERGGK